MIKYEVHIRSKASGKISVITEADWKAMQESGLSRRFIRFDPQPETPLMPEEIKVTTTGTVPQYVPPVTTADFVPEEVQDLSEKVEQMIEENPGAQWEDRAEDPEQEQPIDRYTPVKKGGRGKQKSITEDDD